MFFFVLFVISFILIFFFLVPLLKIKGFFIIMINYWEHTLVYLEPIIIFYYKIGGPFWNSFFYINVIYHPGLIFFLKSLSVFFIIYKIFIWRVSTKILQKKDYLYEIHPFTKTNYDPTIPLISLIYGVVYNHIYNTTYMRIFYINNKFGSYLWEYINLKGFIKNFPYIITGIPRLLLFLFRWYTKKNVSTLNLLEYSGDIFPWNNDSKIIKIGDKWYI